MGMGGSANLIGTPETPGHKPLSPPSTAFPKPSFWLSSLPLSFYSREIGSGPVLETPHPAFRNPSSCHSHFPFTAASLELPNFNPHLPLPSHLTRLVSSCHWLSILAKVSSAPNPSTTTGHFSIMVLFSAACLRLIILSFLVFSYLSG